MFSAQNLNMHLLIAKSLGKKPSVSEIFRFDNEEFSDSLRDLPLTVELPAASEEVNCKLSIEELIFKLILLLSINNKEKTSVAHSDNKKIETILDRILNTLKPDQLDELKASINKKSILDVKRLLNIDSRLDNNLFIKKIAYLKTKMDAFTQEEVNATTSSRTSVHVANKFYDLLNNKELPSIHLINEWKSLKKELLALIPSLAVTVNTLRTNLENQDVVSIEELIIMIAAHFVTPKKQGTRISKPVHNQRYGLILQEILNKLKVKNIQALCESIQGKSQNSLRDFIQSNFDSSTNMHSKALLVRYNHLISYLILNIDERLKNQKDNSAVAGTTHLEPLPLTMSLSLVSNVLQKSPNASTEEQLLRLAADLVSSSTMADPQQAHTHNFQIKKNIEDILNLLSIDEIKQLAESFTKKTAELIRMFIEIHIGKHPAETLLQNQIAFLKSTFDFYVSNSRAVSTSTTLTSSSTVQSEIDPSISDAIDEALAPTPMTMASTQPVIQTYRPHHFQPAPKKKTTEQSTNENIPTIKELYRNC